MGAAAELARSHGVTSLPSVAVWADAESHHQQPRAPVLFSIAEKTDVASRERLLEDLRRAARPSVAHVGAHNYNELCGPLGAASAAARGFDVTLPHRPTPASLLA